MMPRIVCFIDQDGKMGICTHHYTGEFEEGDCSTCSFAEMMKGKEELFSYAKWIDDNNEEK